MSAATGVGSMPGTTAAAYAEAVRLVLGELPDLPHVPELPGRGVTAAMTGRGLAARRRARRRPAARRVAADRRERGRPPSCALAARAGPRHGRGAGAGRRGRLQDPGHRARGRSRRRSRSRAATRCSATTAPAASSRRRWPRASAIHLADLRRRIGGVDRWIVQVDEPALAAVARRPGADGQRFRPAPPRRPARAVGAPGVGGRRDRRRRAPRRGCTRARRRPRGRWSPAPGCAGLSADLDMLGPGDLDAFAEALESGQTAALGVVPSADPADRALRRAPHRARAALARHARPRPGDRGGAPRGHPDLRAGRRDPGVGRPRRTPVGDGRAQPLISSERRQRSAEGTWRRATSRTDSIGDRVPARGPVSM